MEKIKIYIGISLLQVIAMLPWVIPYIQMYSNTTLQNYSSAVFVFFLVLHAVFILSPITSLLAAYRDYKVTPYLLCVFPVLAFINGISAVPYLANIAPTGTLRTIALIVVNTGLILAVFILPHKLQAKRA